MTSTNNEQLIELVSNAQMAFFNGQYHEAFNLAQEAIKLDGTVFESGISLSL